MINAAYDGHIQWSLVCFLYEQTKCPLKTASAYAKMVPL